MPRPQVSSLPEYKALEDASSEHREAVKSAKREAELMMRAAKSAGRAKMLKAVRAAKKAGLSDAAIGRATGQTAHRARVALIAEAMQTTSDGEPAVFYEDAVDVLGWKMQRTRPDGENPWRTVAITNPSGDTFLLRMNNREYDWLVDDESPQNGQRRFHGLAPDFVWNRVNMPTWGDVPPGFSEARAVAECEKDGFEYVTSKGGSA